MVKKGADAYFSWGTGGDLSTYLTEAPFTYGYGTGDSTTFQDSAEEFTATIEEGSTFMLAGLWDSTVSGYVDAYLGDTGAFDYMPVDTGAGGSIHYTGSALLTSVTITPALRGLVTFSATLLVTGGTGRG